MTNTVKTDNHDPAAKLLLRRHFLSKYRKEPLIVLDCCQGEGRLWKVLRKEFTIARYWGIDTKTRKGRMRLDSSRVVAQPGLPSNVIDVDVYGSPWRHWIGILTNLAHPTTVFLTIGRVTIGGGSKLSREEDQALGLRFKSLKVPMAFGASLANYATERLLALPLDYGIRIVEAQEAESFGSARYIGLRLESAA